MTKNGKIAYTLTGKEREQVAIMVNAAIAAQQGWIAVVTLIAQREDVDTALYDFNPRDLRFDKKVGSPS